MSVEKVQASFGSEIVDSDSSRIDIVYLPEGTHTIEATINGKPGRREVTTDDRVFAAFSADLSRRLAKNVRPYVGFDHKTGPASVLPDSFRYEKGVGLILSGEKTEAGSTAIKGRNWSYFSPTFKLKNGIPVGLWDNGEIGSLTNDPAFQEIARVAASHTETTMEKTELLIELGLIESATSEDEAVTAAKAALATLRESASTVETVTASRPAELEEVRAAKAEVVTIKGELDAVKASLKILEDKEAESVKAANAELIQAAVNRGAIPSQDTAAKDFWAKSLESNPDGAKAALAALPGTPGATESVVASMKGSVAPLTREEFDALSTFDRNKYIRSGGKVAK